MEDWLVTVAVWFDVGKNATIVAFREDFQFCLCLISPSPSEVFPPGCGIFLPALNAMPNGNYAKMFCSSLPLPDGPKCSKKQPPSPIIAPLPLLVAPSCPQTVSYLVMEKKHRKKPHFVTCNHHPEDIPVLAHSR